ncbi:hypothetical protein [Desulforegula conservatrix]|uniref:hypothetical protein n=1 Tax=Desulforegula conservatrix TaxID=153026 RepID=UPI00041C83A1|nr:hypothetical protein [Desulforegula conservatrix]
MKKFLTGMVAAATLFSAGAAFAANQVQVTLTSPTIVKAGCEKAGSIQFAFDAGTTITAGDWWYMDLPVNVSLCKSYDYTIGAATTAGGQSFNTTTGFMTFAVGSGLAARLQESSAATGVTGPITVSVTGLPGTAGGYGVGSNWVDANADAIIDAGEVTADKMTFRVVGVAGSRRITVYALGTAATDTLKVTNGYKMNFKIMDGKAWNVNGANRNLIMINKDETASPFIFGESNYTGTSDEVIGLDDSVAATEPAVENTLCINASNPAFTSDLVFVSFASLSDKFTFTGDSQIAHTGGAASITLKNCKSADVDQISISGQSSACSFTYLYTNAYSCTGHTLFNDNLLIQTSSQFGELGDMYEVTTTSMTSGVYFGANPNLWGYLATADACSKTVAGIAKAATTTTKYVSNTASTVAYQTDNKCTIQTTARFDSVKQSGFSLDNNNVFRVDLPNMIYDTGIIGNGVEAKIKVNLAKIPCGQLFEGTVTIGTFVTTCSSATTSTSVLLFPFFPPMDPAAAPGWWGGYVIVNGGAIAGTANLVYADAAGATKTYTTPSIAVGAQFNGSAITADQLTAGTGTFNTAKNYSIKAFCGFDHAAGFAFVSSPEASASYTAYVDDANRFL